jgi:NADH dehydrogenase FAD-containing subunit
MGPVGSFEHSFYKIGSKVDRVSRESSPGARGQPCCRVAAAAHYGSRNRSGKARALLDHDLERPHHPHVLVLVDLLERPLSRLESVVGDAALTVLGDLGVTFLGGCAIEYVEPGPAGTVVHTATHGDLRCDVLVTSAGFGSSLPEGLAPDARSLTVDVDETLRAIGHDALWACGDCVAFPHPRFGRITIPHWDHAIHSGRHAADSVLGSSEPYVRDPYYFSDIGPLRVQQVGLASAVAAWRDEDGLMVGRDPDGRVAAVLFLNAPARLNEARSMLATAA